MFPACGGMKRMRGREKCNTLTFCKFASSTTAVIALLQAIALSRWSKERQRQRHPPSLLPLSPLSIPPHFKVCNSNSVLRILVRSGREPHGELGSVAVHVQGWRYFWGQKFWAHMPKTSVSTSFRPCSTGQTEMRKWKFQRKETRNLWPKKYHHPCSDFHLARWPV